MDVLGAAILDGKNALGTTLLAMGACALGARHRADRMRAVRNILKDSGSMKGIRIDQKSLLNIVVDVRSQRRSSFA